VRVSDRDAYDALQPFDVVAVALTDDERYLLGRGLGEWGGPARATDELALAMGFWGVEEFQSERKRIEKSIERCEPVTRFDWARALLSTEIVFISDRFGAGHDWVHTTRFSDEETLRVLRPLQLKIERVVGPLTGTVLDTWTRRRPTDMGT
jgi:hypothetical protein